MSVDLQKKDDERGTNLTGPLTSVDRYLAPFSFDVSPILVGDTLVHRTGT